LLYNIRNITTLQHQIHVGFSTQVDFTRAQFWALQFPPFRAIPHNSAQYENSCAQFRLENPKYT